MNISKLLDSAELTVLRERNFFSSCAVRCTDFVYKHDDVRPSLSTNATAQVSRHIVCAEVANKTIHARKLLPRMGPLMNGGDCLAGCALAFSCSNSLRLCA